MTKHNLEHLKTFAGKIITLTHEKNPGDNFSAPVKKLRAMAEYILDAPYPNPATEYPEPGCLVTVERGTRVIPSTIEEMQEKEANQIRPEVEAFRVKRENEEKTIDLTNIQKNVLCLIQQCVNTGEQPTINKITVALNGTAGKNTVTATVNELIEQGYLAREGEKKRIVLK